MFNSKAKPIKKMLGWNFRVIAINFPTVIIVPHKDEQGNETTKHVQTSRVVSIDTNRNLIETVNTIYIGDHGVNLWVE